MGSRSTNLNLEAKKKYKITTHNRFNYGKFAPMARLGFGGRRCVTRGSGGKSVALGRVGLGYLKSPPPPSQPLGFWGLGVRV